MTDHLLIHGAFRGGWAWDRVVARLEAAGHRAVAPDLTAPDATLASYIDQLVAAVEVGGLDDVVVAGHSQGGFVARAASQQLAHRLQRLVYIDAPVPADGQTAFDFRPPGTDPPPVERGDLIDPRPVAAGDGMSEADAAWINARLVPQPVAPSMDPVVLDDPAALALPETYVFFSATPPVFPCAVTRAQLDTGGAAYHLIDAPHDGIVTHPDAVADILLNV